MSDEIETNQGEPAARMFTCGRFALSFFVISFVGFGVLRAIAGDSEAGSLLVISGLCLLVIIPAGYLARLVFRGKLGDLIRGEEIDHQVISSERFSFSLRQHKRPLWVTVLLYLLGWVLVILVFVLAMQ